MDNKFDMLPEELRADLELDIRQAMGGQVPLSDAPVPSIKMLRALNHHINRRRNWRQVLISAMIVAPLAICCLLLLSQLNQWGIEPTYRTIEVPAGEQMKMMLADGSVVTLNAESILQYPSNFKRNKRDVRLIKGEGYFEIAENRRAPFTVQTTDADITVLGTKFNVSHDLDTNVSTIYLNEGSVRLTEKVSGGEISYLMKPRDMMSINRTSGECIIAHHVDAKHIEGWLHRRYYFRQAPLSEVVKYIERTYGVVLRVADSNLYNYSYTINFYNEPIDQVLNAIETVTPVRFVRIDNEITMYARKPITTK